MKTDSELIGFDSAVTEPHSGSITGAITLRLEEGDRQLTLMALAHLSLKRPGFDYALNKLALLIDNDIAGRAQVYNAFRKIGKISDAELVIDRLMAGR